MHSQIGHDWDSIKLLIERLAFPHTFIGWIELCYTTPTYFILVNGQPKGFFEGRRGLCRGDPISPLLFVLVMEILASLLSFGLTNKLFKAHPKCKKLNISHLSFADEVLIFYLRGKEIVFRLSKTSSINSPLRPNCI